MNAISLFFTKTLELGHLAFFTSFLHVNLAITLLVNTYSDFCVCLFVCELLQLIKVLSAFPHAVA